MVDAAAGGDREPDDVADELVVGPDADAQALEAAAASDSAEDPVAPEDRLRGLVAYLAGSLVDEPALVEVTAEQRGPAVHLSLRVPETELGKVIGRQGRIARAMRTAVMIAGARYNLRASLDIEG